MEHVLRELLGCSFPPTVKNGRHDMTMKVSKQTIKRKSCMLPGRFWRVRHILAKNKLLALQIITNAKNGWLNK